MDYKGLIKEQRKAAVYHSVVCLLAALPDADVELLDLPGELLGAIMEARAGDDSLGVAAAYAGAALSNADLTPQDQLVVGQVLVVAGARILRGGVATVSVYDAADVTQNQTVFENLTDWIKGTPAVTALVGDAWMENVEATLKYIEQYDRNVKDAAIRYTRSGEEGEKEHPDDTPKWIDWIPFVGKD